MRVRTRGQSLVEFALVVPILIIFIMGIMDFGYYIYTYSELENATRRASEFAAKTGLDPTKTTCTTAAHTDAVKNFILTDKAGLTLAYAYPDGRQLDKPVEVSSTYTGTFITPVARTAFGNNFTFTFTSRRTVISTTPFFDSGNNSVTCF